MAAMATQRLTITLKPDLADAVREAATADEQSVSAWLADAARRRLSMRGLSVVIAVGDSANGAFTDEELAQARADMGL